MDPSNFTSATPGTIITAPEGFPAFVPSPAPRNLELTPSITAQLERATYQLGKLGGIGYQLPNPYLLIAPYLRQEAVLSSRIEGTQTSIEDVYASELEQEKLVQAPDVQEVRNYITAYEYGLDALNHLPLSLRLIKELHKRLMQGARGKDRNPGNFRKYQNWIGARDGWNATYVGPPYMEMEKCLHDFEEFLNERKPNFPQLVQIAIAHYQFEAIHPFGDGNGRVGRLLIPLFLTERELLPQPLLYLSAYFERTRSEYYELLMQVSTKGDWLSWISYFLEGIAIQAQQATDLANKLLGLQLQYRARLLADKATAKTVQLSDTLFTNPLITVRKAQTLLNVSAPTARAAVKALESSKIVQEVTGQQWGKVFEAKEISTLLSEHD